MSGAHHRAGSQQIGHDARPGGYSAGRGITVAVSHKDGHYAAKGGRVGTVIGKCKVAKHFDVEIQDTALSFSVNEERAAAEAALDGLYVIRTTASPMAHQR